MPVLKKTGPAGMSRMVSVIGPVLPVMCASTVVGPTVNVNGPSGICQFTSTGPSCRSSGPGSCTQVQTGNQFWLSAVSKKPLLALPVAVRC